MATAQELPVNTNASAEEMAEAMFGNGISIESASYTGAGGASGIYSDGDTVAPDVTPSDSGVILSTGNATDFTNSSGTTNTNTTASTTTQHGTAGDSDLDAIAGGTTYDAAVFEADFVPEGSTLSMQFVFSSEEYLEYVGSGFNDAVSVWVNGVEAQLVVGDGDITINNINDGSNENLYVDNPEDEDNYNTEMDGFTVTLKLTAPVNPGEVNSIKIAIADTGDASYDSNLLIAGDSIQTALIAGDDDVSLQEGTTTTLDVLANDEQVDGTQLTITHINNQPVTAGSSVTLANGEIVTLNEDGTFDITGQDDVDDDETTVFTYTVEDDDGNSDVAFVNLTTTPCFVAGTLIETTQGPVAVEALEVGMMVQTRDHGAQPIRWIGRSERTASGKDAPVRIAANALGQHDEIELSPSHRVLLCSASAEMLFGQDEVLVPAHHLINDSTIRRRSDGQAVTYFHLLFEKHEIIRGNGLESESYHPGAASLKGLDADTRAEFFDLMGDSWRSYKNMARPTLKSYESQVLLGDLQ
ncbi:choice-of-anchor L domain-containing protein [Epibacterium sp. MM17-32]|uniref:choice-of-anchor L domain-containing protein n=1 Tax=Epibacterium sp. MM17-32 TaxID=2917734 RepID=UPI001EF3DF58|nr:choice-of-anchor L domain-containing protein [Epibacterium sp. MM17-32]MCG7628136.1 choice-of-anchor L domain-containing protein [Epibacterium sp. MM17-32]